MKSPRNVTPKKGSVDEKENNNGSMVSRTPLADSTVYIELDPFAPPPRLSLGTGSTLQSPSVSKSTPKKLNSTKSVVPKPNLAELPAYSGGILFEQLSSPGIALKTVVSDWMNMYESPEERKETVSLLLVNLILWSARVEDDINPENFVTESASQILHDLQDRIEPANQIKAEFPLLDRNKKHRTFRTQFVDFWINWASSVLPGVKNMELIEKVILPWLISMTSAAYRPIRYAATLAVLNVIQGCCKACVAMHKELETLSRVMNSKKGLANKKSVESLSARMADLEKIMQLSIDAVFVQRYRDIDALLREKCVESVHSWIMTYPEVFLDNAYLRYIGWSLSDKVSHVRLASLNSWKSICSRTEFRPALTNFVNRFKTRLFEVLLRDVDKSCREAAGSVIDILFAGSFLESDELAFVDDLVFSGEFTISTLKELMSQKIFNVPHEKVEASSEYLERFASFAVPYLNSESSAETNNFILKQLISHLGEHFPIVCDRSLCAALLKALISQNPEESASNSDRDDSMDQSETSEKISSLLAVLFAQVRSVKNRKGTSWTFEDSAELFNFVHDLIKFINDNEREIYSKDIFYLFSLLNEVEPSSWLNVTTLQSWEALLPILTELFCSIDDLESAKVATVFFKRAKTITGLKEKAMECIEQGKGRLLNDLLRKIPGNMREALKIKDTTILTLVLPLSHLNLLTSLELEDAPTTLSSILNMTRLIDEFVGIEAVYKTTIWSCSLKLVFHELMWKMLEYRSNPRPEDLEVITDIKDRLIDLLSPADLVPENSEALNLDVFERLCTEINMLSDLSLLFSSAKSTSTSNVDWNVVLVEDQIMALISFVKTAAKLVSEPLPRREHESFELLRSVKKSYSSMMASLAKLYSLEIIPEKFLSTLFATLGFGDEVADAVVRVVIERFVPKMTWDRAAPVISLALQESYLSSVMSSEYERLVPNTTIALAKILVEQLRGTASLLSTETAMWNLHSAAVDFFKLDAPQRSEFLGRVMNLFAFNLNSKQAEDLVIKVKSCNFADSFVKTYLRSIEKISAKGNLAQRLLMKRSNSNDNSSNNNNNNHSNNYNYNNISSSPTAIKSLKLETLAENEEEEEEDEKAVDYVAEVDLITQKEQIAQDEPSSPPAILKRKVSRY